MSDAKPRTKLLGCRLWAIVILAVLSTGITYVALKFATLLPPDNPVDIVFDGYPFRIPNSYIYLAEQRVSKVYTEPDSILFEVAYPDMIPFRAFTRETGLETYQTDRDIFFNTYFWTLRGRLHEDYLEPEFMKTCAPLTDGFHICPADFLAEWQEILIPDDRSIAIKCRKIGAVKEPHCEVQVPLIGRIEIEINFNRTMLTDYRAVIHRTYDLVCGFLQPGGPPSQTNLCLKGQYRDRY